MYDDGHVTAPSGTPGSLVVLDELPEVLVLLAALHSVLSQGRPALWLPHGVLESQELAQK